MGYSLSSFGRSFVLTAVTLAFLGSSPAQAELLAGVKALLGVAATSLTHSDTSADYPDLIGIDRSVTVRLAGEAGHCTGTFITPTRVLTAAHCVKPGVASGGVNIDGIASIAAYAHPDFVQPKKGSEAEDVELSAFDIAVVDFPAGTSEFLGIERFPALAKKGFDKGVGYLGGYGMDDFYSFLTEKGDSGAGIRGWGAVNILSREGGVLKTDSEMFFRDRENQKKYEAKNKVFSHCLPGDSGAAVYNEQGEIIAVVSALMFKAEQDTLMRFGPIVIFENQRFVLSNYLIDITSDSSLEVLNKTLDTETDKESAFLSVAYGEAKEKKGAFDNVLLRTGQYSDSDKNSFASIPRYLNGELESVKLYSGKNRASRKSRVYECAAGKCMRLDRKELLVAEQNVFTLFEVKDVKIKATSDDLMDFYEIDYDLKETAKYRFQK